MDTRSTVAQLLGEFNRLLFDIAVMPFDKPTIENLAGHFSFVVDPDGTCVMSPRVPSLIGTRPWDWCVEEDKAACREAFIEACMFRQEEVSIKSRVRFEGRVIRLGFHLFPLATGQVLCLFNRIFEGELSLRERHVLALMAGGAKAPQIAKVLRITQSTARDHIANIKRKLSIKHPEGIRLAAHYFDLSGGNPGM
jgi:hypothetical protein